MTTVAFVLVIGSAFAHAGWNFLLKRSHDKLVFLWSIGAVAFLLMLAPSVAAGIIEPFGWEGLAFGLTTATLHAVYGYTLSTSYKTGELSTVYPVSRGMGPALVPLLAVFLFDETISLVAGFGIALVVVGIYTVHVDQRLWRDLAHPARAVMEPATRLALLTGTLIAAYSLWDKAALDHVSPVTLNGFSMAGHFLFLTPPALARGRLVIETEWRDHRRSIVAAGVLAPLAYVLVLTALTTSQVSYIASVREVGMVVGAFLGIVFLSEGYGFTRVVGAALILVGVIGLAVGA